MRILWLISLLVSTASANAAKYALIVGGAGDPAGDETIFDGALATTSDRLKAANYDTQIAFDGGHAKTEALLRANFKEPVPADGANVGAKFKTLIADLVSGKIKDGDQVLLLLNTHGYPKREGATHALVLNDADMDTGDLRKIQKLAVEHQVRLAIVDASCFSGQSLALARDYPQTCVITGTAAEISGSEEFYRNFANELAPNQSLEDSFLRARVETSLGFPRISTPQDQAAESRLRDLHDNIKVGADDFADLNTKCPTAFIMQLRQFGALVHNASGVDPYFTSQLAQQTEAYTQERDKLVASIPYATRTITLPNKKVVDVRDLANLDATIAKIHKETDSIPKGPERSEIDSFFAMIPELRKFRSQLIKRDPQFAQLVKHPEAEPPTPDESALFQKIRDLDFTERIIYGNLYNDEKTNGPVKGTDGKGHTACGDFKF